MVKNIDEINFRVPGNETERKLGNRYIKDELKCEAVKLLSQLNEDLEPLPRLKVLGCHPKENTYTLNIIPFPLKEDDLKLVRIALINFVKSYFNVNFCSICDRDRNFRDMNTTHNDEEHDSFIRIFERLRVYE